MAGKPDVKPGNHIPEMQLLKLTDDNNIWMKSLFHAAQIGIGFVSHPDRIFLHLNNKLCEMTGYSASELLGQSTRLLYHSEKDYERIGRLSQAEIRDKGLGSAEVTWVRKDGTLIDVLLHSSPLDPGYVESGLAFTAIDITERKLAELLLERSHEWYRAMAEDIPALVCRLTADLTFTYANDAYCSFIGKQRRDIIGSHLSLFVPPRHFSTVNNHLRSLNNNHPIDTHEHTNTSRDGILRWVRWTNRAIFNSDSMLTEYLCIGEDIDEQKKYYDALQQSEAVKSSIVEAIPDTLIRYNHEGCYLDILTSDEDKLFMPRQQMLGRNVNEVLPAPLSEQVLGSIRAALETGKLQNLEYALETQNGARLFESRFKASGPEEVIAFIRDITDRKRYERQLKFLSFHDQLTGLYNRAFFEAELKRLNQSVEYPVTIVCSDLDGLKMINDTSGLKKGDEMLVTCSEIIKKSLRRSDLLARTGGDEFTAVLPRTSGEAAEIISAQIRENIRRYNQTHTDLPLSVSLGIATAETAEQSLFDLFKRADDLMNRDKLSRSTSFRNQIVETLLAALAERDFVTEGHTRRLSELCQALGSAACITSQQLSNLALLARVHDLGKVGIPDQILFKEGPLDKKKWETMKKHSEIGHRIALASPELSAIADLILMHQERYDGTGYPLGLAGQEIPVECRILAIADAFDAMTNDRPYRRAMSVQEAITELEANSGTQFDSALVSIFISLLEGGRIIA